MYDANTLTSQRHSRERHCAYGHRWLEFRTSLRHCPVCGKPASLHVPDGAAYDQPVTVAREVRHAA